MGGGGLTMSARVKQEVEGVSYFKERPGYVSMTTSKFLPIKPIKRKAKTPEKEPEPWSPAVQKIAMVFAIIAVLLALYCTRVCI